LYLHHVTTDPYQSTTTGLATAANNAAYLADQQDDFANSQRRQNDLGFNQNGAGFAPSYGGVKPKQDFGFEEYLNHHIGAGRLAQGQYTQGPYAGLTPPEMVEKARSDYASKSPEDRAPWEAKVHYNDVRSAGDQSTQGFEYGDQKNKWADPSARLNPSTGQPVYTETQMSPLPYTEAQMLSRAQGQTPPQALVQNQAVVPTQPSYQQPLRAAVAYSGASSNTDRFGPAMSGGGNSPVQTTNNPGQTSLVGNEPISSLPQAIPQSGVIPHPDMPMGNMLPPSYAQSSVATRPQPAAPMQTVSIAPPKASPGVRG
jgi:hypothetical protein